MTSIDEVASRMATKFMLSNGVLTYQGLSFNVQGAAVRLDGTHSLAHEGGGPDRRGAAERDGVADADRLSGAGC